MNRDNSSAIKIAGKSSSFALVPKPEFSVLLPTYKRSDALKRTLRALENQSLECDLFEIIVVDDGSPDDTQKVLQEFANSTKHRLSYVVLKENGGPARARNIGLSMLTGAIVLIIGDDIEPDSLLLEKHLHFHQQKPDETVAMLGHVSFPEELASNTFMNWLEEDGRNFFFNYAALTPGQKVDPLFFYTCNVSVKVSLLTKSGWFDESFPYASHEDLELGYRLADKGMRLVYDPSARGYHWHILTIQGIARRIYLMGYSAEIFWKKVGEDGAVLRRLMRKVLSQACSLPPLIRLWNYLRKKEYIQTDRYPVQWKILLFLGFFVGLSDSRNKRDIRV